MCVLHVKTYAQRNHLSENFPCPLSAAWMRRLEAGVDTPFVILPRSRSLSLPSFISPVFHLAASKILICTFDDRQSLKCVVVVVAVRRMREGGRGRRQLRRRGGVGEKRGRGGDVVRAEEGREGRGEVAMANGCGVRAWRRAIKFRARTTHSRLGSKGEAL